MTQAEVDQIVNLFLQDVSGSNWAVTSKSVRTEVLPAPHRPKALPNGWQGVYAFRFGNVWLKVGKAGPKSGARWVSQHYGCERSMSNLAWSLVRYAHLSTQNDPRLPVHFRTRLQGVNPVNIGDWIKQNTDRFNILLDAECGQNVLTRLEEIALRHFKPIFEGRMK